MPIYRNGAPAETVEQRRAALSGYVYTPFRMNDLLGSVLDQELNSLTLEIYDGAYEGNAPARDALLYDSELVHGHERQDGIPVYTSLAMLDIENRPWTLRFTSLPTFERTIDRQKAQVVLVAGIVISLLLFILVRALAVTRERALALAKDMTSAMRESEAKFSSLAESANEAIVMIDTAGKIVSWNPGAQAIFGYAAREIIGDDLNRIMPERYRESHRRGIERTSATGQGQLLGKTTELAGLHRDGSEFPLELSLATWETQQGRFYSGVIRDISEQKRDQLALIENKNLLDLALIGSSLALFDWDIGAGKVYLSEEWAHIIGAPAGPTLTTFDELSGLIHPDDLFTVRARIADVLKGVTEFYRTEYRVRTQAGHWRWIQSHGRVAQRDAGGRALKLTGTNANIDERKALENDLEQRNELLNAVLENVESGIVVCDAAGTLTMFNRAAREFHNLPLEPLPPVRWAEHYGLCRPDGTAMTAGEIPLFKALQEKPVRNEELMIVPKHGTKRVLLASGQALFSRDGEKLGAVVAMRDITEHRQKEQAISAALREKETLLKEVYHRVKNNLQVVTSLFNLQIRTLPDGHARTVLQESADRVRAMALVHEKLYQAGNLSSINLKGYIDDLCHRLGAAAGASERGVDIVSAVEPVDVGLETAVPLGLILNELVSNSLKHAFPDGREGILSVVLECFDDGTALLMVADNGVGMAVAAAPPPVTMGIKLIETLSRQLDGELTFESAGGTRVRLRFPIRP
ncbi:MAG: PAS domain S-box protein [Burkholderiales bacterium]|nr:PAS domain S-box protein [Burkholderiales bacterium]